jgi:hypothetical protein
MHFMSCVLLLFNMSDGVGGFEHYQGLDFFQHYGGEGVRVFPLIWTGDGVQRPEFIDWYLVLGMERRVGLLY